MGAFSSNTPRLLWLCTTVACVLLAVNSLQVSADSKVDTDLVFDNLEQSSLQSHENHPRIERDLLSDEADSRPQVEEDSWILSSVKRLKRSINDFFHKKDHDRKVDLHHKHNSEAHHKKVVKRQPQKHVKSKRKHRQANGQQEADEYEDEDDIIDEEDEDDYADGYDDGEYTEPNISNGTVDRASNQGPSVNNDDEDSLVNSGEGSSGEVPDETFGPGEGRGVFGEDYGHPRLYRCTFTLLEPYIAEFNDRNSVTFQNWASRIKSAIESLYQNIPGEQYASVISIQKSDTDTFKVIVTVDIDSDGYYDKERIRRAIYDQIDRQHRIGSFTVSPENFYFREFADTRTKCESNELQCRSGQCVPYDARCNGQRDCNDNTDEEGCVEEPVIPVEPEHPLYVPPFESLTTTVLPEVTTVTTTTTTTETPFEGSGEDCRADDAVRCPDGSRTICADQQCDGIRDCDDGSDEQNCPHAHECALGEFKCDVSRCIHVSLVCDGHPDCSDGTDEHDCRQRCTENEHECDNKCIIRDQVCDGRRDCEDGSDEARCPGM